MFVCLSIKTKPSKFYLFFDCCWFTHKNFHYKLSRALFYKRTVFEIRIQNSWLEFGLCVATFNRICIQISKVLNSHVNQDLIIYVTKDFLHHKIYFAKLIWITFPNFNRQFTFESDHVFIGLSLRSEITDNFIGSDLVCLLVPTIFLFFVWIITKYYFQNIFDHLQTSLGN